MFIFLADNASQMTSFIVDIAMGTVLLIIVAILIILTCIIVGMCRGEIVPMSLEPGHS